MQKIIVYGAGGHAKAVIDTIEKENVYQIVGLLDGNVEAGTKVYGYEILGSEAWLAEHEAAINGGIIAIGDSWTRSKIVDRILAITPKFNFISTIHPTSSIARGVSIGLGTVIMSGAVVNSDTIIGDHCVLYSHTSVDHDSRVGNYVTFAPKAATGGNVVIGSYSVISMGAIIIHGRTIGEHTIIGASSTVTSDIRSHVISYGTPARVIRTRETGERYL